MKKPNSDAVLVSAKGSRRVFARPRSVTVGVMLVFAVASVGGCASPAPEPSMSLAESRERMLALVDVTAAALGDREWAEASGANLQACPLNGQEGHNLTYVRVGRASSDPERDAEIVREFWESEGYETRVGQFSNSRHTSLEIHVENDDVRFVRYT